MTSRALPCETTRRLDDAMTIRRGMPCRGKPSAVGGEASLARRWRMMCTTRAKIRRAASSTTLPGATNDPAQATLEAPAGPATSRRGDPNGAAAREEPRWDLGNSTAPANKVSGTARNLAVDPGRVLTRFGLLSAELGAAPTELGPQSTNFGPVPTRASHMFNLHLGKLRPDVGQVRPISGVCPPLEMCRSLGGEAPMKRVCGCRRRPQNVVLLRPE